MVIRKWWMNSKDGVSLVFCKPNYESGWICLFTVSILLPQLFLSSALFFLLVSEFLFVFFSSPLPHMFYSSSLPFFFPSFSWIYT
ncbi:hypothetical protein BD289DRAFT_438153 [Coniella lustricola]|uniref:Uncharacterized protein n=1 Tax=Coniella lustricola TaxID=2025994 RepID=A0A2T3A376_9PEZI|nr:hypothetical protein BD289DRAFT_438153 [Coniella lustricola]